MWELTVHVPHFGDFDKWSRGSASSPLPSTTSVRHSLWPPGLLSQYYYSCNRVFKSKLFNMNKPNDKCSSRSMNQLWKKNHQITLVIPIKKRLGFHNFWSCPPSSSFFAACAKSIFWIFKGKICRINIQWFYFNTIVWPKLDQHVWLLRSTQILHKMIWRSVET